MSKRPTRRAHHLEEAIHLNITPFIDILVSLILFLLSSAAILKMSVVDTTLPKLADATVESQKQPDKNQLVVTLTIRDNGFFIGRVGSDASAEKQRQWEDRGNLKAYIPRNQDAKYDLNSLNLHMQRIKRVYPDSLSILILPSEDVNYETIVDVMDATREMRDAEQRKILLFPDAVIGHVSEGSGV